MVLQLSFRVLAATVNILFAFHGFFSSQICEVSFCRKRDNGYLILPLDHPYAYPFELCSTASYKKKTFQFE